MALDLRELGNSTGITFQTGTQQRTSTAVTNQGGKAAKPASFGANIAKSIGSIPGGLLNIAASALPNLPRLAAGITQGLPGIGSISRDQKNNKLQMTAIDAAERSYTAQFRAGKIDKARYKALTSELIDARNKVNDQTQSAAKQYVAPTTFAADLATTAVTPFSAGRLVATAPGKTAVGAAIAKASAPAEALAAKIPGITVNAASRSLPGAAAVSVIKQPLAVSSVQAGAEIPGQVQRGDIKGATLNAAMLAAPLGVGVAGKVLPKVGKALGTAVYGKPAGPIKAVFGNDAVEAAIKKNPKLQPILKQAEEFTKSQPGVKGGVKADQFFKSYLEDTLHLDPKNLTVEEFANRFQQYSKPAEKLEALKAAGKVDKGVVLTANYGNSVQAKIKRLGVNLETVPMAEREGLAREIANAVAGGNPTARNKIGDILVQSSNLEEALSQIKQLDRLPGVKIPGLTVPKGFRLTPAGPKDQAVLTALKDTTGALDAGKGANPVLGLVGKFLEKSGLSTQSQDPAVFTKFRSHLDEELQKSGMNAKTVLDQLGAYAHEGRQGVGVFDERQLGVHSIKQALGLSSTGEAKAVKQALLKAYDKLNYGELGAAGKLENALYKVPGYGQYRRIQGIGRYELNPFFRLQTGVEAEALSQIAAKGKSVNLPLTNHIRQLFNSKSADELGDIAKKVRGHLGEGYTSAGATDNSFGLISAKLTRTQENSIGGLVKTMAEKSGKSVDDFLAEADPQVLDTIRSVVQYPRSGFVSSNFSKALNTLVFPARYNIKLAGIAGKAFAEMPPLMQIGSLKALSDFSTFVSSPEGKKWQADNSEALGIVKYLNPLAPIGSILSGLKAGDLQISDIGMIGGLPLGVITQMLQSTGVTPPGKPYLNPKTGEVVPEKVPTNAAGAAKLMIIDAINSMYSFPGRTFGAGLSKNDIVTKGIPVLKLKDSETRNVSGTPTGSQQKTQAALSTPSAVVRTTAPQGRMATQYGSTPPARGKFNMPIPAAKKAKKGKTKAVRPGTPF